MRPPLTFASKNPPEKVLTIVLMTEFLFGCEGMGDPELYGLGDEYGVGEL